MVVRGPAGLAALPWSGWSGLPSRGLTANALRRSCRRKIVVLSDRPPPLMQEATKINSRDLGKQYDVPHRARGKGPRRDDWTHAREARARSSRTFAKGGSVAQPARTTPPRAEQTSGEAHAQMEKIPRLS